MNPAKRKQIFKILARAHGKPSTELNFRSNFELLVAVVADKAGKKGAALSGLKTEINRRDDGFNERALGYGGFLQFCKAAAARDLVAMAWDDARGDYLLSPAD